MSDKFDTFQLALIFVNTLLNRINMILVQTPKNVTLIRFRSCEIYVVRFYIETPHTSRAMVGNQFRL